MIGVVRRLAVDTTSKGGRVPAGALLIQSTCDHDGTVLALVVTSPDANDDHDTEHTGANDCAELSATNSEKTNSITQSWRSVEKNVVMTVLLERLRNRLFPQDGSTPLPRKQIFSVAFCTFGNTFNLVIIFPLVPFMVASFFPDLPKSELGWRAGYLASAFNVGQLLGSMAAGWLSDKYGRRPIMIGGLVCTIGAIVMFGFSVDYWMAMAARFLWGLLNSNVGIAKTVVSEVCDDTNQARGLSMLSIGTGLARMMSPAIGGALAMPADKWPDVFARDGLFGRFQFLLPTWIGAVIALLSLVSSILHLKETLVRAPADNDDAAFADGVPMVVGGARAVSPPTRLKPASERFVALRLMRSRKVVLSCLLYTLLGMCVSAMSDVLPLWALLPLDEGGFSFDSTEMGLLVLAGAPVHILLQLFVFSRLVKRMGFLRTFQATMTWVGVWVFFLPFVHELASSNVATTWAVLSISWASISSVWMMAFTATFGLVNNSVTQRDRGSANGLSQTMVAVGRIVGPILGGNLFAWSASGGHAWPFDFHFVFHFVGLIFLASAAIAFALPRSIDRKLETIEAESSLLSVADADAQAKSDEVREETR